MCVAAGTVRASSPMRSRPPGRLYRRAMSDEHPHRLLPFRTERALTIDRARALAGLGAIYAFGVPVLAIGAGRGGEAEDDRRGASPPALADRR